MVGAGPPASTVRAEGAVFLLEFRPGGVVCIVRTFDDQGRQRREFVARNREQVDELLAEWFTAYTAI